MLASLRILPPSILPFRPQTPFIIPEIPSHRLTYPQKGVQTYRVS